MKTIGCLHAHYSNINYLEKAIDEYPIILQHFVDPGLMLRIKNNPTFTPEEAKRRVLDQIDWIAASGVDAIVITCTNYIALFDTSKWSIPIIKIDEPFFKAFSQLPPPQTLVFTNPKTVEGTTERLNDYLRQIDKPILYSIEIIPHAFEYLMDGNIKEHNEIVHNKMSKLQTVSLAVAQLSMVETVKSVHSRILNPLDPLIEEILVQLEISILK